MKGMTLDPIVADLAATIVVVDDDVVVPDHAVARARVKMRAVAPSDKERVARDFIAWSLKLQRLGGPRALPARIAAAELALELLGDEVSARDLFGRAGLDKEIAAVLGGRAPSTSRAAPPMRKLVATTAAPKLTRGLKK